MKTAVISAYQCCGKQYCVDKLQHEYRMLYLKAEDYFWMNRLPTEQEAEVYAERHRNTMLGYEYFKKEYLKSEIKVKNPNYPQNIIEEIKNHFGKVDIIFVDYDLSLRQALQDAEIEYLTVCPSMDMLEEFIGRMYLQGFSNEMISIHNYSWENTIENVESEPHGKGVVYLTHSKRYISDILFELVEEFRETPYGVKRVLTPREDGVS